MARDDFAHFSKNHDNMQTMTVMPTRKRPCHLLKDDPIKTVMGMPYLWRSIQLKALHAELLDRRLQANAKRMQRRHSNAHPGRLVLRAIRPVCRALDDGYGALYHLDYAFWLISLPS
eukprot:COSAG01_NODE_6550_length_3613_cov_1.642857_2_plen_117_part_00